MAVLYYFSFSHICNKTLYREPIKKRKIFINVLLQTLYFLLFRDLKPENILLDDRGKSLCRQPAICFFIVIENILINVNNTQRTNIIYY